MSKAAAAIVWIRYLSMRIDCRVSLETMNNMVGQPRSQNAPASNGVTEILRVPAGPFDKT